MTLRQRLWNPYLLVFTSNACIMVIELVASRIIAPRIGVSLYTWTAVIGVILAGISLGNTIGGRLADRRASPALLGYIFALGALATLSIIWLNNDLHEAKLPFEAPLMVWVILYIGGVFMLPSVILGCISPIIVKLSLLDLERTGRTVGKIYAWSSIGSIVGTFATGFYLISRFGTKTTILGVAGLLLALAIWFLSDGKWFKAALRCAIVTALFVGGLLMLSRGQLLESECMSETNYFCINVYEKEIEGRTVRTLSLDRLVHSYVDMDDPANLVYGYEETYAAIIQPLMAAKPDLAAFFIGGGGYTFPRYLQKRVPDSHVVVTEIDPGVTEAAYTWLGLERDTPIEIHNTDARSYLARNAQPASYDLVFGDAFNDFSVPFHLTTLEFDRMIAESLRPDGIYLANIIDGGPHGQFLRAFVTTLQQAFGYVAVIPSTSGWRDSIRSTYVLVASQERADLSYLPAKYQPLTDDELQEYMALGEPLLLTDDYVPVDNLMAPVVEDSFFDTSFTPEILSRISERLWLMGGAAVVIAAGSGWWAVSTLRRRRRAAA